MKAAVKATRNEGGDKEQSYSTSVGQTPVLEQGTGTTAGAGVEEEKEEVEPPAIAESTTRTVPSGSFFKAGIGFLAWALWGHIPFVQGKV